MSLNTGNRFILISFLFLLGTIGYILQSTKWTTPEQQRSLMLTSKDVISIGEYVRHSLPQDDPKILNFIHQRGFLIPPSTATYNLSNPNIDPSMGQSTAVKEILNYMENGFFVECGALDGETRSNTLDLELRFGWKGLLIEGDPNNFALVQRKNRKAWVSNACLATNTFPHQVIFRQNFNLGKIIENIDGVLKSVDEGSEKTENHKVIVQCFPLYSLLAAIGPNGIKTVDYFSLDVEGNEFQVLKTIPWDKILIRVLSVEYIHDKASIEEIEDFMETKGYRIVTQVTNKNYLANDLIFVHSSVEFIGTIPPIKS